MRRAAAFFALALCLAGSGCQKKQEPPGPVNEYKLTGQVVRLDAEHKTAVIKHQKIEGWMEAMTMEFPVKALADFQKLKPGARLRASVFSRPRDFEYWIGNVTILDEGEKQ